MRSLPVIDLSRTPEEVALRIRDAGQRYGFFYLVGHGVDEGLVDRLQALSHRFFALPEEVKAHFAMSRGGRAWRGWFPLGGELTSGRPDWKEGLYLGAELSREDPRVQAGLPMHGPNLIPDDGLVPGFRATIFTYLEEVTRLGHRVMAAVARSLGLPDDHFARGITADPLILFRIFHYPSRPVPPGVPAEHGVGEHTDYGLITLLRQDDVGGLQVRTPAGWIEAAPLSGSFVCNVGDMLDRMTGGRYRSVPHRVHLNHSGRDRLSLPLFFDPSFDAHIVPLCPPAEDDQERRWDHESVHSFQGTYGDYVMTKVGRVFPGLREEVWVEPKD